MERRGLRGLPGGLFVFRDVPVAGRNFRRGPGPKPELDKKLRVFDPRAKLTPVQSALGHQNHKDSRILWIKDSDHILTTAFNQIREREGRLWDSRKLGSSLASVSLGSSSGRAQQNLSRIARVFRTQGSEQCDIGGPLERPTPGTVRASRNVSETSPAMC
ncbi:hypothetical protein SKAU_G00302380 [Synaphobranchus kaupii]|uniref:Uncharacterized protein n=1 Tax=Synaphobranchus kaupii TaxID=118154 RepID=A0A9Q1ILA7_SYNKA|nr:hypothetical protein SKAU_G00302380 [Synaphobranchus kaupii]